MGCQADYQCCNKCTKIIHILLGIASLVIGAVRFLSFDIFSPQDFILSIYLMFIGLLLAFSSCGLKFITRRFLFLNYFVGKGFFDLFIATAVLSITSTFYIILSVVFFLASIYCFFIGCFYRNTEREEMEQRHIDGHDKQRNQSKDQMKKAKK